MNNPLVAPRQDSTRSYTGIGIVESAVDLYNGVRDGSWVEAGLGLAGTGLEALSFVLDPLGSIVASAVSWLIEHVGPLRQALNWLAGDSDQIAAYARTWQNVSRAVNEAGGDLTAEASRGTASWTGPAADAYRASVTNQSHHITAAANCAGIISAVVEVSGVLVGTVRGLVRDLIAECVATLLARVPQWLAEEAVTLGFATPHVVAAATSIIAKWVAKIADKITLLMRSIAKLRPLLSRLDELWDLIKRGLKALRKAPDGGGPPHTPDPVKKPGNTDVKPQGTDGTPPGGGPNTSGAPVSQPPQVNGGTTNTSGVDAPTSGTPPTSSGNPPPTSSGNPPTDGSGGGSGGSGKPPGDNNPPPPTPGGDPHPALPRRPTDLSQPHPELTPAEKAALNQHLKDLEAKNPERFADVARDPDHSGKVRPGSQDEARVMLDLEERGLGPFDRPKDADGNLIPGRGDFVDAKGQAWDMKGAHSDWPPEVPERVRNSGPYQNAYTEQWFRETVQGQFDKGRNVIMDTRNASAADIENMKSIVAKEGWGDRIIWYP
ncbi:hypothetical protein SUDANB95_05568 [Actinosynnema sp. ALI-1.44]